MKIKSWVMVILSIVFVTTGFCDESRSRLRNRPGDEWVWVVTPYAWAAGQNGDIEAKGAKISFDKSASDAMNDGDISAMLSIDVGKNRWGILTDIVYTELDESRSLTSGDIEQLNITAAPYIRLISRRALGLDIGGGVRYMDTELKVTTPLTSRTQSRDWVDPIIFSRLRLSLLNSLHFTLLGDVGGFEVESDLTYQITGTVGLSIGDHFGILAGYRHLYTDYSDGDFTYDAYSNGFGVGVELVW